MGRDLRTLIEKAIADIEELQAELAATEGDDVLVLSRRLPEAPAGESPPPPAAT